MDPRLLRAEAAYLLPLPASPAEERARALRLAAAEAYQAGLGRAGQALLARLDNALFGWVRRSRVRAELEALSDRELADIGVSRGEIGRIVVEAEKAATPRPAQRPAGLRLPHPA
ncbi:DUF1127 domain-containing protein [Roseicella frigidaeris]|uniref:YjiS-like domain-containing protein n=1 Tax=Roseicella frigidaeris TaxID=2230885 RepID=A0A327M4Z3_9PROT|nr:DUF1127 domain-containing protein [Roseicella frigidaeris]RAI57292.1 hypothetical protein DOO78_19915 [Roseicella frigidaeris]